MPLKPNPESVQPNHLAQALKHLSIYSDSFGNVTLEHKRTGSRLVFTNQGDIQLHAARDVDAKTGRWYHVNSSIDKISESQNQVILGPRGEVLVSW